MSDDGPRAREAEMARGRPQATWQSREDCGTGLAAKARCTAMARACPRVGGREGRKPAGGRGLEPGDLQAPGGLLTTSAASPTAGTCKAGSLEPSGQLKREAELCWQLERARHSALPALCFFIALLQPQGRRRASLWFLALLLAEGKKKGNCPGLPGSRASW